MSHRFVLHLVWKTDNNGFDWLLLCPIAHVWGRHYVIVKVTGLKKGMRS